MKRGARIMPLNWDFIINWGDSTCPYTDADVKNGKVLNNALAIKTAANKLSAFRVLKQAGVSVPAFATGAEGVTWSGTTVARHKLTGHSGEGIEICPDPRTLPDAPLYVEYVKKKDEYRIHVVGDEVTTIQRKGLRSDFTGEPNWQVRNHKNGFVFVRNGDNGGSVAVPESVLEAAKAAIAALGLDFGAVDIVVSTADKKPYVLEVNTAPGMEGSTIQEYADAFQKLFDRRDNKGY